jgi:hypothetical protein
MTQRNEQLRLGPRARDNRSATLSTHRAAEAGAGIPDYALDLLFGIRESAEYELALFQTMLEQTLEPYAHLPEVAQVLDLGSDLMATGVAGDRARASVRATEILIPGKRRRFAVYTQVGRIGFLMGLTSAGKANGIDDDLNLWVSTLAEYITNLRPEKLVVGPFSRAVRNQDFAGQLAAPLRRFGTQIFCAEAPAGFRLNEAAGDQIWTMLCTFAHQEWLGIVSRLLTGTMFALKNNCFPRNPKSLPLGYRIAADSQPKRPRVEPDPGAGELVRAMITMAASDMSLMEIAEELSALGVRTRAGRLNEDGQQPLLRDVADPEAAVMRLLGHLPTYLTGLYLFTHANPLPGRTTFHGLPVYRDRPGDDGEFRIELNFGLPDSGWHDPRIIEAAIERRLVSETRGSARTSSGERKPLAGIARWSDDEFEYTLDASDPAYALRRRVLADTVDPTGRPIGWTKTCGERIASVPSQDLHGAVSRALKELARQTSGTNAPCLHEDEIADEERLISEAAEHEKTAKALRALAAQSDTDAEQLAYKEDAREHHDQAMAIYGRVSASRERLRLAHASRVAADLERLEVVAELLDRHPAKAPVAVNLAIQQVIQQLRLHPDSDTPTVTVDVWATVATDHGPIVLGPASQTVRNTRQKRRERAGAPMSAPARAAKARLVIDPSTRELYAPGMSSRNVRRVTMPMALEILPTKAAASAILDCPLDDVRAAVLGPETGCAEIPDHLDPQFVTELRATYYDPGFARSNRSWATRDPSRQRSLLTWMSRYAADEDGVDWEDLRSVIDIDEPRLYSMLEADPARYPAVRVGTAALLERTMPWPARRPMPRGTKRVRLPLCPHCGERALLQALRVPELPDGVLCVRCRRAPSSPHPYPDGYLLPWVGPQQGTRTTRSSADPRDLVGSYLKEFVVPPRFRAS